ncbi:MAG: 16S rRNA (cytosine(1402)-N(4))-methyltransferase RsmH [Pseudomonadota bacterium]
MSNHIPVMLNEVLETLSPKDGEVYVDGTFGAGGYSRAFLEAADCTVIAIDRDADAIERAQGFKKEFGDRFIIVQGCFGDALELVRGAGFHQVDGFVLDIGVSSFHLDEAERGFSFRFGGPLDMRMDQSQGQSAANLVNDLPEKELADVIYKYGEERKSRHIAKRIVEARKNGRIDTTFQLADLVRAVVPKSFKDNNDPATRSFQALRIAVNDELGELERALTASQELLKSAGRLVVVSFHSLEDGIVKSFLYEKSGRKASGSRHLPQIEEKADAVFDLPFRKPLEPSTEEKEKNLRARSARLRAGIRTEAAA